ncbi:MAG TPA: hypothetical protein VK829_18555 [Terriglobales bacterium]|nr:hypothetical protein [Terriglobales bacterium]
MFPKNTAEFAYANLKEARKYPWYAQFKSQALPLRFSDLEHFLASIGVDDHVQVDELAWAVGSGETAAVPDDKSVPDSRKVLGVVLGNFDPEAAKSYMKTHKVRGFDYRGYTLYPCTSCADLALVFIDSSTVAFGPPRLLEQLIEVRVGAEDSLIQNEKAFALISQINGRGIFWGVLNQGGTRQAVREIVPNATQFPQASELLNKLSGLIISIQGSSDLQAHFQLISSSAQDSAMISQLLQVGVFFRQFEVKDSNPDLATLLDSVRIAPNGEGLDVSVAMTNELVVDLINRKTFSR